MFLVLFILSFLALKGAALFVFGLILLPSGDRTSFLYLGIGVAAVAPLMTVMAVN
jgi:hypothetical protein